MRTDGPTWHMNHEFGRQLRHFFWSGAGSHLLRDLPFGWCDGGCLIAAEGLLWWMRAHPAGLLAHLALVVSAGGVADHVVVGYGGLYLDADGLATKNGLLQRWARRERLTSPRLAVCEDWRLQKAEIPRDQLMSDRLYTLLDSALGSFCPELLFTPAGASAFYPRAWP